MVVDTAREVVVPARELLPRPFLPAPGDIIQIARIAREIIGLGGQVEVEIPYRYGPTRRRLRIFPGGWWDSEVRRDHEGERGARL
jgi:hypothetical protein